MKKKSWKRIIIAAIFVTLFITTSFSFEYVATSANCSTSSDADHSSINPDSLDTKENCELQSECNKYGISYNFAKAVSIKGEALLNRPLDLPKLVQLFSENTDVYYVLACYELGEIEGALAYENYAVSPFVEQTIQYAADLDYESNGGI